MKKINRTWGIIIPFFLLMGSTTVTAQTTVSRVTSDMRYDDWTAADKKYAYLQEDEQTAWWYRYFTLGYEYKIMAFSEDGDVIDVKLEVEYADGRSFDYDIDDLASVYVKPLTTGVRMRIRMSNYLSDDPDYASKCHFIVFLRKL
jgi:hypothetical protein